MDCLVCRLEKILHEGQRLLPEVPLKGNELTELEHPHPEPVNTTLAFQQTQGEQLARQAVDRAGFGIPVRRVISARVSSRSAGL